MEFTLSSSPKLRRSAELLPEPTRRPKTFLAENPSFRGPSAILSELHRPRYERERVVGFSCAQRAQPKFGVLHARIFHGGSQGVCWGWLAVLIGCYLACLCLQPTNGPQSLREQLKNNTTPTNPCCSFIQPSQSTSNALLAAAADADGESTNFLHALFWRRKMSRPPPRGVSRREIVAVFSDAVFKPMWRDG